MRDKILSDPLRLFSHELKTPISSLKLALSLIKKSDISLAEKKELTELMDQEIQGMTDFINEALDFRLLEQKGDIMKFQWESPEGLIERSLQSFKIPGRQKKIRWRANSDLSGNIKIFMDSLWIRQAVNNLISNAVRHSPEGAEIEVSSCLTKAGSLRVSVKDEGAGLSADEKAKLWSVCYKRHANAPGAFKSTGLGLAVARAVIEKHQGLTGVSSDEKGSVFYFELPKVRQEKQTA